MRKAIAMLAVVLLSALANGAGYPLEIIELHSRPAEELIPILTTLAGPDGSVAGKGGSLFVRTTPERLAEIRRTLESLDRPPKNLLIQVRMASTSDRGGIELGWDGLRAGRAGRERDVAQEVRVLDGRRAFITTGTERPVAYRERHVGPNGSYERRGTMYRSSRSGFHVTPRVVGEQVTLEIDAFDSHSPSGRGSEDTAALSTVVTGRLGEWVPLGSAATADSESVVGTGGLRDSTRERGDALEIRVLEAP